MNDPSRSPATTRRCFLAALAASAAATTALAPRRLPAADAPATAPAGPPKKVLLRSSWQAINIGDIAHTPGMLALLDRHLPQSEITLWPNRLTPEVAALLMKRFPKLKIAESAEAKRAALDGCDFFLHGSGPGLVGVREMARWKETGKPYGVGGVTLSDQELRDHGELLSAARFVFCRDTHSLKALKDAGVTSPVMEFGPDATFHLDLRNDAAADAILKEHALEPGEFACFVPRLRYTPYWKEGRSVPPEQIEQRHAVNEKHKEADHAKIRAAIAAWVIKTGQKALLCPEMTYEVELLRPLLFDGLPDAVKEKVAVRPRYWLTDEAASVYARAAAVVSLEMHSPIIAVANNTPAIHVREPTDTRKGQMWRDVGLSDWMFEVDDATGEQIAAALLDIHANPDAAKARVAKARAFVAERGGRMMKATAGAA